MPLNGYRSTSHFTTGGFLTLGSPLIDITVKVDKRFLDNFGLKENDAVFVNEGTVAIFDLVKGLKPKYLVGGCSLNTARALQWVLKRSNFCTVLGAVGDDDHASVISAQLSDEGVKSIFQTVEGGRTGRCAVLLNGSNRSLCTDLGASQKFTLENLMRCEAWTIVETSSCYYIPGFFLSVSRECVKVLAKHATNLGKTFAFNLSAPFIVSLYKNDLRELLTNVDLLFGNQAEIRTLAKEFGYTNVDLAEILLHISELVRGTIIVTRGPGSVFTVCGAQVTEHVVEKLEAEKVKDTSAAGDCFVGGFLAAFIENRPIAECVNSGVGVARNVIQSNGCWFK
ncbi:hypothetical protein RI129_009365 [Pyrocoelia pectoralis]|uniref:Adenosine kinase n=1 Tax=Pyrocoelia pectoralis TaxID=417401 RepID=A0AAN7V8A0_9COLE